MAHYKYDRLTAQDASFLVFETPNVPMHVAGTLIFEAGPLKTEDGGIDIDAIRTFTQAILHLIPRYRQKLARIPLARHPVWIDDRDFNLDYHIRHTSLPRPGSMAQLKKLSSRIMGHRLDRAKPLWETWVVEGLEGDRFAMISKFHHCMIDGESGVDLSQILLSPDRESRLPEEAPAYIPRPEPTAAELLREEAWRRLGLPFQVLRGVHDLSHESKDLRHELAIRARAVGELVRWSLRPPSDTPMNGTLSPHRRFDWLDIELADVKAVCKATDRSVNDIVLATVAGAVRDFLIRRRVRPEVVGFQVSAPVNVRGERERGRLGNRVSSWIIPLPVGESDPLKRLEAVYAVTHELKESHQALGVEMIMAAAEWAPRIMLSLAARAVSEPINMIVTNVPGPQVPLYMLGAKLLASYPQVPLLEGTGLGVALLSYNGKVCWGFNADYNLVPDIAAFRRGVERSFRELSATVGVAGSGADVHGLRPGPGAG
jgi:WS/DGAT/MGAT family acyltransferase